MNTINSQLLVIFGASGDLTARKLLPALFELHVKALLPEQFAILGAARTPYSDEEHRHSISHRLREVVGNHAADTARLDSFLKRIYYVAFNSTLSGEYTKLKDKISELR